MQISLLQLQQRLEFRYPTTEELEQINQFRPKGTEPYTEAEIYTFPILASNNLLHKSLATWSLRSLETMVATYPGKDLMLDHAWENSGKTFGFIWDAELWQIPKPTEESLNKILVESPYEEIDRELIQKEGLYQVVLYAAIEASHPIASEIRYKRKNDVSIGGNFAGDYVCPLCNISFEEKDCPHYPPLWFYQLFEDPENIAPYYIRDGQVTSVEVSFVASGNCPQAAILSENLHNLVLL